MQVLLLLLALSPNEVEVTATPRDPIVCERRSGASLGTNIAPKKRKCMRQSEWDAEAAQARRNLQRTQDRRSDPFKVPGGQPIPQ